MRKMDARLRLQNERLATCKVRRLNGADQIPMDIFRMFISRPVKRPPPSPELKIKKTRAEFETEISLMALYLACELSYWRVMTPTAPDP